MGGRGQKSMIQNKSLNKILHKLKFLAPAQEELNNIFSAKACKWKEYYLIDLTFNIKWPLKDNNKGNIWKICAATNEKFIEFSFSSYTGRYCYYFKTGYLETWYLLHQSYLSDLYLEQAQSTQASIERTYSKTIEDYYVNIKVDTKLIDALLYNRPC